MTQVSEVARRPLILLKTLFTEKKNMRFIFNEGINNYGNAQFNEYILNYFDISIN